MASTFAEYQQQEVSEKITLAVVEAGRRLLGWVLHSGSIYKLTGFENSVVTSLTESGAAYSQVASLAAVGASKFYIDRAARTIYLQTSDSTNPNGKFIACIAPYFFSNCAGIAAPWDLGSGFEVEWLPLIASTDRMGVQLDNQYQLGEAIEGDGSIEFHNDPNFWQSRYDKLIWENQRARIYSWNRAIPITEAKIIYRGRIQGKSFDISQTVKFDLKDFLNELRATVSLPLMSAVGGARIPDNLLQARQRRIYGRVNGLVPINIDQVLEGYPVPGTIDGSVGSTTITGSATAFLLRLAPEDELIIPGLTDSVKVGTITSDTVLDAGQKFDTAFSGVSFSVKPATPKRWMNRTWFVAGHALREPAPTITQVVKLNMLKVDSYLDLDDGCDLQINGELTTLERRFGAQYIKLSTNLINRPSVGQTVLRPAISNVRLGDKLLRFGRDYTYDAALGRLYIAELAEFNVTPISAMTGTAAFTSGSRTITGTGTQFKTEFKVDQWIRLQGQADWFEILSVDSDTQLTLRAAATYTGSGACDRKAVHIFDPENDVLTCSVLGKTLTGAASGALIGKGATIVKDLLTEVGLGPELDTAAFTTAEDLAEQHIGIALPATNADTADIVVRDVIAKINKSIFGSIIQSADFLIQYNILSPERRASSANRYREHDILKLSVESNVDRICSGVTVQYDNREYDYLSKAAAFSTETATSDIGTYITKTTQTETIETVLVDDADAIIMAYRWALLLEIASSVVTFETKMQGARLQVNDKIDIIHEKLYQRMGGSTRKIAAIQRAQKDGMGAEIDIEDLANCFTRAAVIAEDTTPDFVASREADKIYSGYLTDTYGMQANDPDTAGINLIW